MQHKLLVLVSTPAYSRLNGPLVYLSEHLLTPGTLVRVPLGVRETLGLVWPGDIPASAVDEATKLRPVLEALDHIGPLTARWMELMGFAAAYYQRSAGEFALGSLPPQLRDLNNLQLARKLNKRAKRESSSEAPAPVNLQVPAPTPEQALAMQRLSAEQGPFVLHGNTGSGKTEVYLRRAADVLAQDALAQVLMLVPEINLTPQLEDRVRQRFTHLGDDAIVSMHSGMTPAQRLNSWLSAHTGLARLVLGTRLAVLASLPHLKLIVVDEEHDPSYKQQDGARYSARDLAVYRGRLQNATVLLASATPSLESWYQSRSEAEGGRYVRLHMPSRIGTGLLPQVRRVDMSKQARRTVLSAPLLAALQARVERGEQSMLLLNRRG